MLRERVEDDRHVYANATECRHNFAEIAAAQLIGCGINDTFSVELVHCGIVVGTKPAQRFVPEALKRVYECGTYCTPCFGKAAYPAFSMDLVDALLLDDLPRSLP